MKPCSPAMRIVAPCTAAAALVAMQRAQMLRLRRVDGARRLRPARP